MGGRTGRRTRRASRLKSGEAEKLDGVKLKESRKFGLVVHGQCSDWGGPEEIELVAAPVVDPKSSSSSSNAGDAASPNGANNGGSPNGSTGSSDKNAPLDNIAGILRSGVWSSGNTVEITSVMKKMEAMEDRITINVLQRAEYGYNYLAYHSEIDYPALGYKGRLVDFYIMEFEKMDAKLGEYKNEDVTPFYPRVVMEPTEEIVLYPKAPVMLHPHATSINLNSKIKEIYLDKILHKLAQNGSDSQLIPSLKCDINILQAISKRVHYGKFLAEARFQDEPSRFIPAIRQKRKDVLWSIISDRAAEEKIKKRVNLRAERMAKVCCQTLETSGSNTWMPPTKPEVLTMLYDSWVIPWTKEVEVEYLLRRLD